MVLATDEPIKDENEKNGAVAAIMYTGARIRGFSPAIINAIKIPKLKGFCPSTNAPLEDKIMIDANEYFMMSFLEIFWVCFVFGFFSKPLTLIFETFGSSMYAIIHTKTPHFLT